VTNNLTTADAQSVLHFLERMNLATSTPLPDHPVNDFLVKRSPLLNQTALKWLISRMRVRNIRCSVRLYTWWSTRSGLLASHNSQLWRIEIRCLSTQQSGHFSCAVCGSTVLLECLPEIRLTAGSRCLVTSIYLCTQLHRHQF